MCWTIKDVERQEGDTYKCMKYVTGCRTTSWETLQRADRWGWYVKRRKSDWRTHRWSRNGERHKKDAKWVSEWVNGDILSAWGHRLVPFTPFSPPPHRETTRQRERERERWRYGGGGWSLILLQLPAVFVKTLRLSCPLNSSSSLLFLYFSLNVLWSHWYKQLEKHLDLSHAPRRFKMRWNSFTVIAQSATKFAEREGVDPLCLSAPPSCCHNCNIKYFVLTFLVGIIHLSIFSKGFILVGVTVDLEPIPGKTGRIQPLSQGIIYTQSQSHLGAV